MAGEWRASTWGEEVSLEYGKAFRDHHTGEGKYRVYGANGPIGWTNKPLVDGPGVILGRKGAYRGVEYATAPFWVIDTAYFVAPKSELDTRWLYYAIKHYKLGEIDDGSPIPSTTRAAVYMLDLDVPPLPEQHAIAHILGMLDDKIELNRRMSETLEAMARALFKSWFVDFGPVRDKTEGRDPGLPKHLADLFPARLVGSDLGEIPEGWSTARWGDLVTLEYGRSLPANLRDQGPVPVFGTNGQIGRHVESLCHHGGIIVGRKGAYRGILYSDLPFFVIDTAFYVEPKVDLSLRWAYYELLRFDLNAMDSGSAIPSTSREEFYQIPAVLPTLPLQRTFEELMGPCWARIRSNERQQATLSGLRDSLLPKLISGEVTIQDAERFVQRIDS